MDGDLGQEIATLSENIWLSVLGLAAASVVHTRRGAARRADGGRHRHDLGRLAGRGDRADAAAARGEGRVDHVLARRTPPTLEDVQDALGEITNMTGGNLKALMPGSCHLSLPAVIDGNDYRIRIPTARVLTRVLFECDGLPAVISLVAAGGTAAPQLDASVH